MSRIALALALATPAALAGCDAATVQMSPTTVARTPEPLINPKAPDERKAEEAAQAADEKARAEANAAAKEKEKAKTKEVEKAAPEASAPPKAEVEVKDLAADEPGPATATSHPDPAPAPDGDVTLVPLTFDEYLARAAKAPKAKYTIVDAWATWCGPCKENFPHLVAMHKKYADQGLNVVSLSLDDTAEPKAIAEATAFLKSQGATFTNVVLKEELNDGFERLDINAIPAVFVYDPSGREVRRFTLDDVNNQFTYDQVEAVVQKLLKGEALPPDAPGEVHKPRG